MKPVEKLEIGKRYWLDNVCDVSGVLVGIEDYKGYFNDIEGKNIYHFSNHSIHGLVIQLHSHGEFYEITNAL